MAVLLWALLLSLAACSDHEPVTEEEIVIGLIAPVASDFFRSGVPTVNGASLAVEEINAAGGVRVGAYRRPIRLIVEDSGGQPETAVSKAFKLAGSDQVAALIGLTVSDSALAVAKVAEELRVPLISTSSTHPEITRDKQFAFRTIFADTFQARALAELARADFAAQRAALLFDAGSAYSRGFAEVFAAAFTELGGHVTVQEGFTADEGDLSSRLRRIQDASAEVLVVPVYPSLLVPLVVQVRTLGIEIPILGGDSWGSVAEAERCGWGKSLFIDVWSLSAPGAETRAFVEGFRRRFDATPESYSALAYDTISLLAHAIELQEDAAPESIRAGLLDATDFVGVTGAIRYEDSGDPVRSAVILQIEDDGSTQLFRRLDP